MQVDPIKPTLKAPGTKRLKLGYDKLLSNFAFEFNLRAATPRFWRRESCGRRWPAGQGLTLIHIGAQLEQLQDTFMR